MSVGVFEDGSCVGGKRDFAGVAIDPRFTAEAVFELVSQVGRIGTDSRKNRKDDGVGLAQEGNREV